MAKKKKTASTLYERALEKENLRLQRQIAALKAENTSLRNKRIAEFEDDTDGPSEKILTAARKIAKELSAEPGRST